MRSTLEPCGKLELDKYMCALSFCRFGTLVKFWCMRFEGNYFKDLAHRVKSFKNIPKTMAYRHQELVCYYVNSIHDNSPFCKENKAGPGIRIHCNVVEMSSCQHLYGLSTATKAVINTLKYKKY